MYLHLHLHLYVKGKESLGTQLRIYRIQNKCDEDKEKRGLERFLNQIYLLGVEFFRVEFLRSETISAKKLPGKPILSHIAVSAVMRYNKILF
jgi:hypothetical protein